MILRIYTSKSGKEAAHYFVGSKSQEAYYSTDGQEFAGNWGGKAAAMMGLQGRVTDESLARLFKNQHPLTGDQLTPRMRADRRPGFDVNFNVPKSVSLAYAWTKDERIIRAFRQAVLDTMLEMEQEAATRVRANGQRDGDRKTGNLVWAEIIHLTARPQGGIPDPHLHSHCYVFNATWDEVEQKWKALQMGRIHEEADYYDGKAMHRLAENLKAIGLDTEPTKNAFEIAGFWQEFKEKFSRRTLTIEAEAIKRGITDPAEKAKLAALTRERKSKSLLISEIEPYWWGNLQPEERKWLDGVVATLNRSRAVDLAAAMVGEAQAKGQAVLASSEVLGTRDRVKSVRPQGRVSMNRATSPTASAGVRDVVVTEHDYRAVALGKEHVYERRSVVSEKRLIGESLKSFCVGRATHEGIAKVVSELPLIRREIDGRMMVTTEEVLAEEKRIAEACLSGKGKFSAANRHWEIRDEELTVEQQNAVRHVLSSQDFIIGIAGNPGVGKTRILREIKRGIEASPHKMLVLAPRGTTVHDVLRKEGFDNAETVAMFLASEKLQYEARDAVLLVDEAGQLSTRETDRLIQAARELGARLVLAGDVGQHHAVERGQAFDLLRKHGEMDTVDVLEIKRQRGAYKFFVESLLQGDIDRAFRLAARMEALVEMPFEERRIALANQYVAAIEKGETALVVAPTHVECNEVTEGIRAALKEKGLLKSGYHRKVVRELEWTEEQKSCPAQYKPGFIVEMTRPVKGTRFGEQLEVIGVREDMVRVRSLGPEGRSKPLPLHEPGSFVVRESVMEEGREWDILRDLSWTEAQRSDCDQYRRGHVVKINGHVKGFALGEELEVIGVSDGMVRVRSREMNRIKALPLGRPKTLGVYERDRIEICEGDLLRLTGNGRTKEGHRLQSGSVRKVDYIAHDGALVLDNGHQIRPDFKHLSYGYTLTSHAAQGKTVDRVLVAVSPELSLGAIDLTQLLVSATRGRKGVTMYTTSIDMLREQVSERKERMMATELVAGEPRAEIRSAECLGKSAAVNAESMEILAAIAEPTLEHAAAAKTEPELQTAEWLGTQQQLTTLEEWTPETKDAKPPELDREQELEIEIEM